MNMFSDIDQAWRDKRVAFTAGEHIGKIGTCSGFRNYYGGAGLQIICDNGETIMVYSRELDNIEILANNENKN